MLHFENDYLEGAHPSILKKLMDTNMEQTPGYGTDPYCESARNRIRSACNCPEAEVHFLVGGTQTNATVIKSLLRSYEGVVAADSGHISIHEAGAIEAGGHKVLVLPHDQGKISAGQVENYLDTFYQDQSYTHMVQPGMVYISHPTEYGTLYTRSELEELSQVCKKYKMPLFLDGARLGYGLMADNTDVTLEVIAKCCDVFYIGGTKVGALFGEAVVITRPEGIEHFFTTIKQQGGLLAKGRLLGIQFDVLFQDDLYKKIARHAIEMANKLKQGLVNKGYILYLDSQTNQQFVIMENKKLKALEGIVSFAMWETYDETHTVIRLATSWATKEEDIDLLLQSI